MQGVPRDIAKTVLTTVPEIEKIMKSGELEGMDELCRPLWSVICRDVVRLKRRLGGDFAIAQAVISRERKSIEEPIHYQP